MRRRLWLLAFAAIGGACGSNEGGAVGDGTGAGPGSNGADASLSDGGRDNGGGSGARIGGGDASVPHYDGGSVPTDAGPLGEYAVDPIAQPPGGESLDADDKASSPVLLRDANPAGSGDLFGVFKAGPAFFLLVSTDGGATWRYFSASGGSAPEGVSVQATAITQDTSAYRVHWVTAPYTETNVRYHRVALAYTAGHISGWSWEAADRRGPAFDATGGNEKAPRIALEEAIDASGAHVLVLVGVDQPSDVVTRRLVAARTSAGPRALAPSASSDWGKVEDGLPGVSVLGAWSTTSATDPEALVNFAKQDGSVNQHNATVAVAQLPADGSLNVFAGTMYYNDTDNHGDITRWRLTRSTSGWSLDTNASGKYVAPPSASPKVRPCLGNAVATVNYVWVTWGDARGVHIGRVDASGAWTADAVASPDTASDVWWYSALNVADNETEVWLMWERNNGSTPVDSFGRWDGKSWAAIEDTALWDRNPSWNGVQGGASIWTPIGHRPRGVGVMAYGYADWGESTRRFSVHSTR